MSHNFSFNVAVFIDFVLHNVSVTSGSLDKHTAPRCTTPMRLIKDVGAWPINKMDGAVGDWHEIAILVCGF